MHHQIHRRQRQNGTNEAANLLINAVQANECLRLNGTNETAANLLIDAVKENDTAPLKPPAQPAKAMHFVVISAVYNHFERFTGSICQINIEVHDPNTLIANYTHQQFFQSFDTLVRSGQFALMNTDMYTGDAPLHLFLRMFFVNVVDEKCTKKFLC
ncbi:hypothetical protein niasHT_024111 [Heterodera trifolii]|uniref:Uncharacterized protein n=1 Tax=Heterodera trifolii TaxID=157864 RepID=A0ABD2KQH8_9BILA